jgi:hypothetical protein
MYHHGIGVGGPDSPGYILPVGKAEDEQGQYGVNVTPLLVTAATKFSQSSQFAQQVFALYAEKILRGFSVNALPIPGTWKRIEDKILPGGQRKPCFEYGQWFLKEYSATALPVNPEALATSVQRASFVDRDRLTVALQSGKIISEKFHKVLQRDLSPFMLTPKVQSNGVTIKRGESMDYEEDKDREDESINEEVDDEMEKPNPSGDETPDEAESETDVEGNGDENEGEVEKAESADPEDLKPTPRAAMDGHQMIRDLRTNLLQTEAGIEDEQGLAAFADIQDHLHQIEQIFTDVLLAKGVKGGPAAMATEELRAMCKKAKPASNPEKMEAVADIMKATKTAFNYRPARFGVIKAAVVPTAKPEDKLSPEDLAALRLELRNMQAIRRRQLANANRS